MNIGIPKEIKDKEGRVALTPEGVRALVSAGHAVLVQTDAGVNSGFSNDEYLAAGATLGSAEDAWSRDLVVKVKEPEASEYGLLHQQTVFTYFHLAGVPRALTQTLLQQGTTAVAYETLEDAHGRLPLLAPMSAIAGNMAALMGAYYLGRPWGGKGVQLGEVLGTRHGKVLVIGDGVVGYHAAKSARGLGAHVTVAGLDDSRAGLFSKEIADDIAFLVSSPERISEQLPDTDLLIGGVLTHGAKADYVITEAMVKLLKPGSVVVDVSIDQGGCIETSHPTSHSAPIFEKHGVTHYCVTNMPGAYPRTSTLALTQATFPYLLKLANEGLAALRADAGFAKALNTYQGYVVYRPVAEALDLLPQYRAYGELFGA
jgi:alanine dehydrogenase